MTPKKKYMYKFFLILLLNTITELKFLNNLTLFYRFLMPMVGTKKNISIQSEMFKLNNQF